MASFIRHFRSLPFPAKAVVLSLGLLVPFYAYALHSVREWQSGGSPAAALTAPYFWAIMSGRAAGAIALAVLLLYRRRPTSVAVTVTAVWLCGPPLTFLWRGIEVLAVSGGRASWAGDPVSWIMYAGLLPACITLALLVPKSVRAEFGLA
ncbi:hypothetical protein OMP43_16050 [Sphingomonas sp. CBMAI 2297]|uniref:hypothetical protein n=1 Tax=Sphingomonas sp. CBMAI 2297 TaxID=2991720 RepID=UPI002457FE8F|nr:hypothetical protein [Sphingomonas sp. CBMAI 2297]MDH4745536.1 hypothetical protein [Sphingomonas sp. CBMAI 2297]